MKFACRCGALIHGGGDGLAHRARLIADHDWFPLLEAIDETITSAGPGAGAQENACMKVRQLIAASLRMAWQCRDCGRLWIDGADHRLREFMPENEQDARELFRRD